MHTTHNHNHNDISTITDKVEDNAKTRTGRRFVRRTMALGAVSLGLGLGSLTGVSAASAGPLDGPILPIQPNCALLPGGCPVPEPDPDPVVNPDLVPDFDELTPIIPCWILPEGCPDPDPGPVLNPDLPQIDPELTFPTPCWQLPMDCPDLPDPPVEEEPPAEEPPAEEPPAEEPPVDEPPAEESAPAAPPAEEPAPAAPAPTPTTPPTPQPTDPSGQSGASSDSGDSETKVLGISVERVDTNIPVDTTTDNTAGDEMDDEEEAIGEIGGGTSLGPIAIAALGALAGITGMALLLPVIRRRDPDTEETY